MAASVPLKYKRAVKDHLSIVKTARSGVAASIFSELAKITGINAAVLAEHVFNLSLKTFQRYISDDLKLNPRQSEIALKLLRLYLKGKEVFGSFEDFATWMNRPAHGLGKRVPFELLNTNTGIDLIEEELLRIEFGAVA